MTIRILGAAVMLSCLLLPVEAIAKPDLTPEQLQRAREVAAQIDVDFDFMLSEADRLGVVCDGDLTRKIKIATCDTRVKGAQSEERERQNIERAADIAREQLRKAQ